MPRRLGRRLARCRCWLLSAGQGDGGSVPRTPPFPGKGLPVDSLLVRTPPSPKQTSRQHPAQGIRHRDESCKRASLGSSKAQQAQPRHTGSRYCIDQEPRLRCEGSEGGRGGQILLFKVVKGCHLEMRGVHIL